MIQRTAKWGWGEGEDVAPFLVLVNLEISKS